MTEESPATPAPPVPIGYEIQPTGQPGVQYTDIALTALFGHHLAHINSIRQAIWQRFTAFLIANSIITSIIFGPAREPAQQADRQAIGGMIGVVICGYWIQVLRTDYQLLVSRYEEASQFKWLQAGADANPFATMLKRKDLVAGRKIFKLAAQLILVFLLLHATLVVYTAWPVIKSVSLMIVAHMWRQ